MKAEKFRVEQDTGGRVYVRFQLDGRTARAPMDQKPVFIDQGYVRLAPLTWEDRLEPMRVKISDFPGYEGMEDRELRGFVRSPELARIVDRVAREFSPAMIGPLEEAPFYVDASPTS